MPSTSQRQQNAMRMAYAVKTGKLSADKVSPEIRRMADGMSEKQLQDFASARVEKEAGDMQKEAAAAFMGRLRGAMQRKVTNVGKGPQKAMNRLNKTASDSMADSRTIPGFLHNALMMRRHPHPMEAKMLDDGRSQFFPKFLKGPDDPLTEDMASPVKGAIMYGALGGGLGGAAGYKATELINQANPTGRPFDEKKVAALTGAITAILAGMAAGIYRNERNKDVEDEFLRLPVGATRRDRDLNPILGGEDAAAELGRINAALKGRYRAKDYAMPVDHIKE